MPHDQLEYTLWMRSQASVVMLFSTQSPPSPAKAVDSCSTFYGGMIFAIREGNVLELSPRLPQTPTTDEHATFVHCEQFKNLYLPSYFQSTKLLSQI